MHPITLNTKHQPSLVIDAAVAEHPTPLHRNQYNTKSMTVERLWFQLPETIAIDTHHDHNGCSCRLQRLSHSVHAWAPCSFCKREDLFDSHGCLSRFDADSRNSRFICGSPETKFYITTPSDSQPIS